MIIFDVYMMCMYMLYVLFILTLLDILTAKSSNLHVKTAMVIALACVIVKMNETCVLSVKT